MNALLFQRPGQWKFSIVQAILWFEQKMGIICQKAYLFAQWILSALRPIPTNCNDMIQIAYWIPRVVFAEPLKPLMQGSSSKIVQKNAQKFFEKT